MQKAYTRLNWENYPSTNTPLNETNLNKVDVGLNEVDNRVVAFDTTKADQSDLLTCVASISFDDETGILTVTRKNGTSTTIDTGLAKLSVNFDYDDDPTSPHYQQLIITMADGTYKYVDMSALITQYEFTNTSTIAWTVESDGTIKANIVDGSITADKLQPNFLADCVQAKTDAETAAGASASSALVSEGFAVGEQNGTPVASGSPYKDNNAKHYAQEAADIVADLLRNYGVSVVGTQLVFGVEFLDSFNVAVVGTQLQITSA